MFLAFSFLILASHNPVFAAGPDTCTKGLQSQRAWWETSPNPLKDHQQLLFDKIYKRGGGTLALGVQKDDLDRAKRSFGLVEVETRDAFLLIPPGADVFRTVHTYNTISSHQAYQAKLAMVRDALHHWAEQHLTEGTVRLSFAYLVNDRVKIVERVHFPEVAINDSGAVRLPDGTTFTEDQILASSILVHYPASKSLDGRITFPEEDMNLGYRYGNARVSMSYGY